MAKFILVWNWIIEVGWLYRESHSKCAIERYLRIYAQYRTRVKCRFRWNMNTYMLVNICLWAQPIPWHSISCMLLVACRLILSAECLMGRLDVSNVPLIGMVQPIPSIASLPVTHLVAIPRICWSKLSKIIHNSAVINVQFNECLISTKAVWFIRTGHQTGVCCGELGENCK